MPPLVVAYHARWVPLPRWAPRWACPTSGSTGSTSHQPHAGPWVAPSPFPSPSPLQVPPLPLLPQDRCCPRRVPASWHLGGWIRCLRPSISHSKTGPTRQSLPHAVGAMDAGVLHINAHTVCRCHWRRPLEAAPPSPLWCHQALPSPCAPMQPVSSWACSPLVSRSSPPVDRLAVGSS